MAVEKDKVLAAIELKFKGKSISKTFKDNIASKWAAKIEEETEIEDYINDREEIILEAVAEGDRRATDAAKKAKEQPKTDDEPKPEPKTDDNVPEWAKALIESNKVLKEELTTYKAAQTQKSIQERFESDERLKGVPKTMFKGRLPQNDDEFETAVTDLAADWSEIATANKIAGFGNDKPAGSNNFKSDNAKADPLVEKFAKHENEKFINENKK